jgi:hypothetical protein
MNNQAGLKVKHQAIVQTLTNLLMRQATTAKNASKVAI